MPVFQNKSWPGFSYLASFFFIRIKLNDFHCMTHQISNSNRSALSIQIAMKNLKTMTTNLKYMAMNLKNMLKIIGTVIGLAACFSLFMPHSAQASRIAEGVESCAFNSDFGGTNPQDLANILYRCGSSESERARSIYAWIASHIRYDAAAYVSNTVDPAKQTPSAVLSSRMGVCAAYANLYDALAKAMGLQSSIITGVATGKGPHAWNLVVADGARMLVDSTWGAGNLDAATQSFKQQYNAFYFGTNPGLFRMTDSPNDPAQSQVSDSDSFKPFYEGYFTSGNRLFEYFDANSRGLELVLLSQGLDHRYMVTVILDRPMALSMNSAGQIDAQDVQPFDFVMLSPGFHHLEVDKLEASDRAPWTVFAAPSVDGFGTAIVSFQ